MTDSGREMALQADDAVEAILGQASPRPVPPEADSEAIRDAVRAEWRHVTRQRRARSRISRFAIAASVLIAVFAALNMLRIQGVAPEQVATIDKRFGSVFILGDKAELLEGNHLDAIVAGQTLITDADSGLGLYWAAGGSLRIDAKSRVEFVSAEQIYLRSGRVYFDSAPEMSAGSVSRPDAMLTVLTDFGTVSHVGTQYMVRADADRLIVSVRDGEVAVRSGPSVDTASRHQQLEIFGHGGGAHSIVNIGTHGEAWEWLERTAPTVRLDGRSVSEFLDWVSHETGLSVEYESAGAAASATRELLNGTLDTGPRQALDVWLLGTDFVWRIAEGVIYVDQARQDP